MGLDASPHVPGRGLLIAETDRSSNVSRWDDGRKPGLREYSVGNDHNPLPNETHLSVMDDRVFLQGDHRQKLEPIKIELGSVPKETATTSQDCCQPSHDHRIQVV